MKKQFPQPKIKTMTKLKVGCSPLTGIIYAGRVLKNGMWTNGKQDVTDDAVGAVAQHLLYAGELFQFDFRGKTYQLKVEEFKK